MNFSVLDALVVFGEEGLVCVCVGGQPVEFVASAEVVLDALVSELDFLLFDGSGLFHVGDDAEEEGDGVFGERLADGCGEEFQVEVLGVFCGDGGAACATVVFGYKDAVDVGLAHDFAECIGDFGGGDVFAPPSEGIAHTVAKVEETICVLGHEGNHLE